MRFLGAFAILTVATTLEILAYVLILLLDFGPATLQLATVALVAGLAVSCLLALWYLLAGNRPISTGERSRGF
jgi:hypothetical protein